MNATLGILGGGQLAMLMCHAAREVGVLTKVLSPAADVPARFACDQFVEAPLDDIERLLEFARGCTAVTIDHEHVPLESLLELSRRVRVAPDPQAVARIQDRLEQRIFLQGLEIPQTAFRSIDKPSAVRAAAAAESFPVLLKRRRGGYDGQGQVRADSPEALADAWEALGRAPCVLEAWVPGIREFSVIGAVDTEGGKQLFPPAANLHREGQLHRSDMPAALSDTLREESAGYWHRIADALSYCGVLTVEFFLTEDDRVLVNEIAPRVHNSGHVTQFSCSHDQFELHVRAVCGLSLPAPVQERPGVMLNLYPQHGCTDEEVARAWEAQVGGRVILYGKTPRPRRKMGHWLLPPEAAEAALRLMGSPARGSGSVQALRPSVHQQDDLARVG